MCIWDGIGIYEQGINTADCVRLQLSQHIVTEVNRLDLSFVWCLSSDKNVYLVKVITLNVYTYIHIRYKFKAAWTQRLLQGLRSGTVVKRKNELTAYVHRFSG